MDEEEILKQEMLRIYQEFQQTLGRFLVECGDLPAESGNGIMPALEALQQPLQSFVEAYGIDFNELMETLKKELN